MLKRILAWAAGCLRPLHWLVMPAHSPPSPLDETDRLLEAIDSDLKKKCAACAVKAETIRGMSRVLDDLADIVGVRRGAAFDLVDKVARLKRIAAPLN